MSKDQLKDKRKIIASRAVDILRQNGREISEKEAEKLLDLMYFLAKLIANQNFKK